MTGFGRGEAIGQGKKFTVEMKSVNHRFLEISIKIPRGMMALEEKAKRFLQEDFKRGKVDVFISIEDILEKHSVVKVNKELALGYYKAIEELVSEIGMITPINLEHLLAFPEVISLESEKEDVEGYWSILKEALSIAVLALLKMREEEGNRLKEDLLARFDAIRLMVQSIEKRSPEVVKEYKERLNQRLLIWLEDVSLDMDRLMNEVAFFADRSSITEELVRLDSHLIQGKNTLEKNEPVGRKLDFLLQEMNREINTIASKASDLKISSTVVEVKSELEKIREQIQNLE